MSQISNQYRMLMDATQAIGAAQADIHVARLILEDANTREEDSGYRPAHYAALAAADASDIAEENIKQIGLLLSMFEAASPVVLNHAVQLNSYGSACKIYTRRASALLNNVGRKHRVYLYGKLILNRAAQNVAKSIKLTHQSDPFAPFDSAGWDKYVVDINNLRAALAVAYAE